MIRTWHFKRDGKPTGGSFMGSEDALKHNIPEGCTADEGEAPPREYQPPAQSPRQKIARLEQLQARALRELVLDPENPRARERLQSIDVGIKSLREQLSDKVV